MGIFTNAVEANFSTFFIEISNAPYVASVQNFNYKVVYDKFLAKLTEHLSSPELPAVIVYRNTGYAVESIALYFPKYKVMIAYGMHKAMQSNDLAKVTNTELSELYELHESAMTSYTGLEQSLSADKSNKNAWTYEGEDVNEAYAYGIVAYYNSASTDTLNLVQAMINDINNTCTLKDEEPTSFRIFDIESVDNTLRLKSNKVDVQRFVDNFESNYNDELVEATPSLIDNLNDDTSGFYFLDGDPGTGKTSFLMSLVGNESIKKKFVYISSESMYLLTSPAFISFAKGELEDSIIVIEDAEEILRSRDSGSNLAVVNILNLTSGMYGELLKIKVIATVNTHQSIDKALFRSGRLKFRYTFGLLEPDKCNKIFARLGINYVTESPMTLADVYNYEKKVDYGGKKKAKIGFNT